jgi:YVTN family beta-propeller protein
MTTESFLSPASGLVLLATVLLVLAPGPTRAADAGKDWLLVCNKGDRTLSVVDPVANQQVATVAEDGQTGHEVVASPDGQRAFVPIYGSSGVGRPGTDGQLIRVIDLAKHSIAGTVDFGKGVRPHCARIGPKNGLLYVTTELENSVTIIDPLTLTITGSVPTGQAESHMLIISGDGRRGYTANVGPGTVSVLDLTSNSLLKIIPVCKNAQRIAISPDDRWVFTADQIQPRLAVISTARNELVKWIKLPATAYGTAPTPNSRWLLLALQGDDGNALGVVDLQTMALVRTIPVPPVPQEVLVRPDGAVAYVSCDASKQVAVIDLKNWKVAALIDTGKGTDGLAWAAGR